MVRLDDTVWKLLNTICSVSRALLGTIYCTVWGSFDRCSLGSVSWNSFQSWTALKWRSCVPRQSVHGEFDAYKKHGTWMEFRNLHTNWTHYWIDDAALLSSSTEHVWKNTFSIRDRTNLTKSDVVVSTPACCFWSRRETGKTTSLSTDTMRTNAVSILDTHVLVTVASIG